MESWMLYGLLSAVSASLVAIFGKMGLSRVDGTLAAAVRAVIMATAMIIAATALGKWRLSGQLNGRAMFFIALSGLAGAASWLWYFLALKTGPVVGVVALDRLSVVFAVILAALFIGERLTLLHGAGAALVAFGAFLLTR